jgi:uncharacterized membrane protein YdjX (TVP38/TMEM64 family)
MPAVEPGTHTTAHPPAYSRAWSRWVLAAGLVLAVASFYALGLHRRLSWDVLRGNLDQLEAHVRGHLAQSLLIFFAVYVALTALSLPAAGVLSVIAGALFERLWGTIVVSAASTLGATLAMLATRYLFRDFVQRRYGDRLEALQRGIERDGAYYLLSLRLVPLIPFFLINLGMGLTRMPARTFALVSWLGMLPASFVFVNAGTAISRIDSPAEALTPGVLISLALLAVLPLLLRWLVRWKTRPRTLRMQRP